MQERCTTVFYCGWNKRWFSSCGCYNYPIWDERGHFRRTDCLQVLESRHSATIWNGGFAAEEITSLEEVFPSIPVFICSFHREQAWNRRLSQSCHSEIPSKEALKYLRRVANAATEEELEDAIKDLREWEVFQKTDLKKYFNGTWFPEIRRWALSFKPKGMYQNTNNGVERMNKELKYGYLEGLKGCSLSELV